MALKCGDVVLTRGCVSDSEGVDEHAAMVTKVHSDTDVDCVIFVVGSSGSVNLVGERRLRRQDVAPTGKRFVEKGA